MSPLTEIELECPSCGTVAINRDFCSCGEYLAWDVEQDLNTLPAAPPAPQPATYRPAPVPEGIESTLLTLRDPARHYDPSAAVSVSVLPGTDVTLLATVRNQGPIVDAFDVRVDGLPDAWWTLSSSTVFLNPWGTSGDYEQEVQVRLHPPAASESEARAWPLTVVARSRSLDADVARAQATLTIQPFQSTLMSVGPERRRGRRRASFDVVVENRGNSPVEIVIGAQDTAARCPVTVTPERATVPAGESVAKELQVGVPHALIFARPVDHRLLVTHRADGVESDQQPTGVTFQQRAWMSWWIPPAIALLAAFITMLVMLHQPTPPTPPTLAPDLSGRTVANAILALKKNKLRLGHTTYAPAPEGEDPYTIIHQVPEAGAESIRKIVDITLAAPPDVGIVPAVKGRPLAKAAQLLDAAGFGYSPQPSNAGDDWVVIRQDPAPGSKLDEGKQVTLAVQDRTAAATPTPTATPTPAPAAKRAPSGTAKAPKPKPKPKPAAAQSARLPTDFVFAGATSGRLYRWASQDGKAARLTSPKYRLETPTTTDDGYVAVQVRDDGRRLVSISPDGKTVEPIAEGSYHRPAYSPRRGLLAVISSDGQGDPADAGKLCVMDPHHPRAPACAAVPDDARGVGRPAWAPNGRSVLVLTAGADGDYDGLLSFVAKGGDAKRWGPPTSAYRSAGIRSAAWVGNDRIAVLLADSPGAPAHLRLLARRANGSFRRVKDFPALTGSELAATGHYLALRRGNDGEGDGAMVLLDVDRTRPRIRSLSTGVNPAWAG